MSHEYGFEEILETLKKEKEKDIRFIRTMTNDAFSELSDLQLEHLYSEYSTNWFAFWLKISSEEDIKQFVDWAFTTPLEKIKNTTML